MSRKIKLPEPKLPQNYKDAREALRKCKSLDEILEWKEKAEQIAAYGFQKQDNELIDLAREIKIRAQRQFAISCPKISVGGAGGLDKRISTPELRRRVRALRAEGKTVRDIARICGISAPTVYRIITTPERAYIKREKQERQALENRALMATHGVNESAVQAWRRVAALPEKTFEKLLKEKRGVQMHTAKVRSEANHSEAYNILAGNTFVHAFVTLANKLVDIDPVSNARDLTDEEAARLLKPAQDIQKWVNAFVTRLEKRL